MYNFRSTKFNWIACVFIIFCAIVITFSPSPAAAVQKVNQDSVRQVISDLRNQLSGNSDDVALITKLGYAYLDIESWDMAMDRFKRAVELDDQNASAYNGLGRSYHGKGESAILPIEALKKLFKVDNYSKAEKQYKIAVEIDPEYIAPYYNLGVNYLAKGGFDNYARSVESLQTVLEKDPLFRDADFILGVAFQHQKDFVNAELQLRRVIDANRWIGRAYIRIAEIYLETGKNEPATEAYYAGLESLRDRKTWEDIYAELEILLDRDNKIDFHSLPWQEKGQIIQRLWKSKDPTPTTLVNERLIEHFRRIRFARENYPDIIPPYYDDRGKIYVKYGDPDAKYTDQMKHADVKDNESWSYEKTIAAGLTFDFVKKGSTYRQVQDLSDAAPTGISQQNKYRIMGELYSERADFTDSYNLFTIQRTSIDQNVMSRFQARRYEAEEKSPPEVFTYEQEAPFLPFVFNVAQFRGDDNIANLEVFVGVANNRLKYNPRQGKFWTNLNTAFIVQDSNFVELDAKKQNINLRANTQAEVRNTLYLHNETFALNSGNHHLSIRFDNPQNKSHGAYRNLISVRDFSSSDLMLSDIQLSSSIAPATQPGKFVKNNLKVIPYPYTVIQRKRPLYIYFEIYNLKYDQDGQTNYTVTHTLDMLEQKRGFFARLFGGGKKAGISTSYQQVKRDSEIPEYISLDLSKLPAGMTRLTVAVMDNVSGETTSQEIKLQLLE